MADHQAEAPPRFGGALRRLVELVVLCSFAIGQPLLDVSGRSPETFVFYRVAGVDVILYALLILVVPPVAMWLAVTGFAMVSAPAGRVVYLTLVCGLVALTVLQIAKKMSALRGPVLMTVALLVAAGTLWLFARSKLAQSFVTYLIPAPLVFALLFVLTSPTGELVSPQSAGSANASSRAGGATSPIVMVMLDELPLMSLLNSSGQVDGRVFPNFARVARTSHWFRNATAISPFTATAVPAILSGRYPQEKLVPSHVEHPDNLFSLLAPDYRIRAFETITQLCDPAKCAAAEPAGGSRGMLGLFGQIWRVAKTLATPYEDQAPLSDQFAEQSAGTGKQTTRSPGDVSLPHWKAVQANQPERFQRFIAGLRPRDKPTMHFLHLLLPHHPWRYLPSGVTYPDKLLGGVTGRWGKQPWPIQVDRQAHLLQLAYTDRLLGEIIDRLQKQGMWHESVVVITADHGESFVPGKSGRRLTSNPQSQAQLAWVPVFIKEPGQSTDTTSDANWEQVDLLPTIADILGRTLPFEVDGISQLSGTRHRSAKYFYNSPSRRITFPVAPGFRIVLGGVTDTFVRGAEGQAGLFMMGSRPDWIGQRLSSLASLGVDVASVPSLIKARLADEVDVDSVDPSSGIVPSLVTGTLEGSAGRGSVLIAVNGTVAAVSEIYPENGKPSFAGFVNDGLFKDGVNNLAIYEVVGQANPELRPVSIR